MQDFVNSIMVIKALKLNLLQHLETHPLFNVVMLDYSFLDSACMQL